jgi:hypothetical protein
MDDRADEPGDADESGHEPGHEPGHESGAGDRPAGRRPHTGGGVGAGITLGLLVALLVGAVILSISGGSSDSSSASAAGAAATGGPSTAAPSSACTPTAEEPLDPSSVVRLLPNAPEPTYQTDPPTSGAFQVGVVVPAGSSGLTPAQQVGVLAQGYVLLQYQGISADELASLNTLAGPGVVVVPNAGLTAPVVATAWRKRQVCTAVDVATLRQFITLNADQGPQAGPNGTGSTTSTTSTTSTSQP